MRKRSRFSNLGSLALLVMITSLWCGGVFALDPQRSITQYSHAVWDRKQGLAQDLVTAIIQTRDGYLWFGSQEGLARFDGVRFTLFNMSNTKGFKSHSVNYKALHESRDGSLWIGTNLGLTRYKDGKFITYSVPDGLSNENATSIYEDRAGSLWVGTTEGLNRFRDGKFTAYTTKDGLPHNTVKALSEDREGRLWIGTDKGLSLLQSGKFINFDTESGLSSNDVQTIYAARDGNLWVGTNGGGLNLFRDGKFTAYTTKQGLTNNNITSLCEDQRGNLWIGTLEGLNRLSQGQLTPYTKKEGLSHNLVTTIYEDREGSLWVGTMGGGVNQFRDSQFTSYTFQEGLLGGDAWSIIEDRKGSVWIGTYSGLNQFQDGKFKRFTTKEGLSGSSVFAILEDRAGSLWVGTFGGGLNRLKEGKFTSYTTKDGLLSNIIRTIIEDRAGSLWIGTQGGLSRFKDGKFTNFTTQDGLPSGPVRAIIEDHEGDLWIALTGGLSRFKDGKFSTYTTKEGLASISLWSMFEDSDGVIWISSFGGLSRLKGGKITPYTTRDGLLNGDILQTLQDDRGYLWMSGNNGIFRVAKKELNDFADGSVSAVTSIPYDTSEGLLGLEFNGGNQAAGTKTRDGKLWFPTTKGVVVIDPNSLMQNKYVPPVIIEEVTSDKRSFPPEGRSELPPGRGDIEIRYTGLSFAAPEKVKFRYKLEGFNADWVDAGTRRTAYYTNLPPGNYTFRVIASNNDGVWNETGASVQLRLRPHFYQTTWFYALCVLAVVLTGFALYRIRIRQLRQRTQQLEEIVDQRTGELKREQLKVLKLEKQATEQQMAGGFAHEMRNALAGSKLVLDQALGLDGPEPHVSLNLANCGNLKEIYLGLKGKLPQDDTQVVLDKMQAIFANEERLNEIMRVVRKATSRGLHITKQIMDYSKVGQQQRGQQRINLNDLIVSIINEDSEEFLSQGIVVKYESNAIPISLLGDENHFYSVIKNLALNARDALIDPAVRDRSGRRINITTQLEADVCTIVIADNGVGIPEENLRKIFEPFFSTKPAAGTGLGLGMVKKVVSLYNGTIGVSSDEEQGTLVTISIPVGVQPENNGVGA